MWNFVYENYQNIFQETEFIVTRTFDGALNQISKLLDEQAATQYFAATFDYFDYM